MPKTPLDALINEIRDITLQVIEAEAHKALLEMQFDQAKKSIDRLATRKRLLQDILKSYSEDASHNIILSKLEAE